MGRWSVVNVEGILGGIDALFPAFEQGVAEHALDRGAGNLRELEELRQGQGAAFFEHGANSSDFFVRGSSFVSWRIFAAIACLPGNYPLRFWFSAEDRLAKLDKSQLPQPLKGWRVEL